MGGEQDGLACAVQFAEQVPQREPALRLYGGVSLFLMAGSFAWGQSYTISTYAGGAPPPTPAPGASDSIGQPLGVAMDAAGNVYFASDNCVFKLNQSGVLTRAAGNSRPGYSGDGGPASSAQLFEPSIDAVPFGVAVDTAGNLFIADAYNDRIRKVTPAGVISTIAGNGGHGFSGDGGPATNAESSTPLTAWRWTARAICSSWIPTTTAFAR